MNTKKRCPECNHYLVSERCECGFRVPNDKEMTTELIPDHLCQYRTNGKRCPLPGTMSPNIRGNTWYCCEHWRHLGDPKMCETILINAEINYEKIMDERIDWRRKLWKTDFITIKKNERKDHE